MFHFLCLSFFLSYFIPFSLILLLLLLHLVYLFLSFFLSSSSSRYRADFPSSSPYIVSTGATTLGPPFVPGVSEETGVTFSSGGFSNHFPRPSFQQQAVQQFIEQTPVSPALFNSSGRGFPDVSTIGVNFQVVNKGETVNVGGTSAATPTFAAMVSLLNELRLARGKPTMGWILPWLYKASSVTGGAFTDVTKGSNPYGTCAGFNCTIGWDPMTGLGTPRYNVLAALAMKPTAFWRPPADTGDAADTAAATSAERTI